MRDKNPYSLLHHLRWLVSPLGVDESDGRLLEKFLESRDESAFAALLGRHGPMVFGVSRRLLSREHDAEDVVQAVFLLLARKAASIRKHPSIGPWLHGVAHRLSVQLKRRDMKRQKREARVAVQRSCAGTSNAAAAEARDLLDAALQELPEQFRAAIILCCLEGRTHEEAARLVGCPLGTMRSRVARARNLLHERLSARGLALSAAGFAAFLTEQAARATLPAKLFEVTLHAAARYASGKKLAGVVSGAVVGLVNQGLKPVTAKAVLISAGLLSLAIALGGFVLANSGSKSEDGNASPVVQETKSPITEQITKKGFDQLGDPLPAGAIMRLGTVRWRPGGSIGHLAFSPDGKQLASWQEEHATTRALTISEVSTGRELRRVEMPDTQILNWTWLDDGRGISIVQTSEGPYLWEFSDVGGKLPDHKPETGQRTMKVAQPAPDNEEFGSYAISHDGKYLAGGKSGSSSNKDREIVLWELATQRKVSDLGGPKRLALCSHNCKALFFSPDGTRIVACCPINFAPRGYAQDVLVSVFDIASGKELRRFKTLPPLSQGSRMTVAVSNKQLAIGLEEENGKVLIWDLGGDEDKDKQLVTGHKKSSEFSGYGVSALAFAENGATLITAGRNSAVKVWNAATGKELRTIENAYPGWIETLAITKDNRCLACAGQGGTITHWDLRTGAEFAPQADHGPAVTNVAMTGNGAFAVTSAWFVNRDRHFAVWDLKSNTRLRITSFSQNLGKISTTSDGKAIVGNLGGEIRAWSIDSGETIPLPSLPPDVKAMTHVLSPDGKIIITHQDDKVKLIGWPTGELRREITLPEPAQKPGEAHCAAAALAPDGQLLATLSSRNWYREERGLRFASSGDGVLDLWNAVTGKRRHRLAELPRQGRTVHFTADGDLLFDGEGKVFPLGGAEIELKGAFHLVDPLTGRLKLSYDSAPLLPGASYRYNAALNLSPDGRSVYCAGNDGVIHVYETATGKIRRSLSRHRGYVTSLAFTGDGRRLLTASTDLTALMWDVSLLGFGAKVAVPPAPAESAKLWERLAQADAKDGYRAMATLAAHPATAVALIHANVKPVTNSPDDATLNRLVADLGSETFAVRERAARDLNALGEAGVPGLRVRLEKSPPLETHLRIVAILNKHDPVKITPTHLREIRALEILEQLNSPESRAELAALAHGAANARLTRAASASLHRLKTFARDSEAPRP